jgi:hypothetical protein
VIERALIHRRHGRIFPEATTFNSLRVQNWVPNQTQCQAGDLAAVRILADRISFAEARLFVNSSSQAWPWVKRTPVPRPGVGAGEI